MQQTQQTQLTTKYLNLWKAEGRGGLVPKRITETVHGKNKTFQRTRTVMTRPDEEGQELTSQQQVKAATDFVEEFHSKLPTYYVGGVVRDRLIGKTPRDVDVISVGTPDEIKGHLKSMGVKYFVASGKYEIVTAQPSDGVDVEIIGISQDKLMADLERRDFTINAMGQSPDGKLLDPFGGQQDLKDNILRSPNDDSDTSFTDDPIRMLRAARFIGAQGFEPSKNLMASIKKNKKLLDDPNKAPRERFQREIEKATKSPNFDKFLGFMADNELLEHIHPALQDMVGHPQNTPYHKFDVWEHTLETIRQMNSTDPIENMVALLHDVGKPASNQDNNSTFHRHEDVGADLATEIMRGLKYNNAATERVSKIIKNHMWIHNVDEDKVKPGALRRFKTRVGDDLPLVMELSRADSKASANDDISKENRMEKRLEELPTLGKVTQDKAGLSPLNGNEIIAHLGIKPGKIVRDIKDYLHALVEDELLDADNIDAAKVKAKTYYNINHKDDSSNLEKSYGSKLGMLIDFMTKKEEGVDLNNLEDISANDTLDRPVDLVPRQIPVNRKGTIYMQTRWMKSGSEDNFVQDLKSSYNGLVSHPTHSPDIHEYPNGQRLAMGVPPPIDEVTGKPMKPVKGKTEEKQARIPVFDKKGKLTTRLVPHHWTEVHVDHDPHHPSGVGAKGRNPKTNKIESIQIDPPPIVEVAEQTIKFDRVKKFTDVMDAFTKRLEESEDTISKDADAILYAISKTSWRVGEKSGVNKKRTDKAKWDGPTYGISTLRAGHVTVSGNTVSFNFTGKAGAIHSKKVTDPKLAQIFKIRLKGLDRGSKEKEESTNDTNYGDFIFGRDTKNKGWKLGSPTSGKVINSRLRELSGVDATAHNIRHHKATDLTTNTIDDIITKHGEPPITRMKDYEHFAAMVAIPAARELIHSKQKTVDEKTIREDDTDVTRASYIDPRIYGELAALVDTADNEDKLEYSEDYLTWIRDNRPEDFSKLPPPQQKRVAKSTPIQNALMKTWGFKPDWHGKGPQDEKDPDEQAYNRENHSKAGKPKQNSNVAYLNRQKKPKKIGGPSYLERLTKKGYFAPIIKEVSSDGKILWFEHGGKDFTVNIFDDDIGDVQKATFFYSSPNKTGSISPNEGIKYSTAQPQSKKNKRFENGQVITDEEED